MWLYLIGCGSGTKWKWKVGGEQIFISLCSHMLLPCCLPCSDGLSLKTCSKINQSSNKWVLSSDFHKMKIGRNMLSLGFYMEFLNLMMYPIEYFETWNFYKWDENRKKRKRKTSLHTGNRTSVVLDFET